MDTWKLESSDLRIVLQATVKNMLADIQVWTSKAKSFSNTIMDIQARGEEGALEWAKKLDGNIEHKHGYIIIINGSKSM